MASTKESSLETADFVIKAFNDDLPYNQFVIENIAGDLIPEASAMQKVASGYNRLLQTTEEGGAQADDVPVDGGG